MSRLAAGVMLLLTAGANSGCAAKKDDVTTPRVEAAASNAENAANRSETAANAAADAARRADSAAQKAEALFSHGLRK
jgi:hypothetical protein